MRSSEHRSWGGWDRGAWAPIGVLASVLALATASAFAGLQDASIPAGEAAITLDAVSSSGAGTGSTLTWAHTVGSGPYRMLVVGVGVESTPDQPAVAVTYGSQSLSRVSNSRAVYEVSKTNATELWYLPAPNVGTAMVTVAFSGTVAGAAGGAVSLFGVDQGAPESVSTKADLGGDGLYSLSITTLTDRAWVIDVVNNGEKLSTDFVPGSGQTERWDLLGNDQFRLAGSTREVASAGVVTDTWTCVTVTPGQEAQSMAAFAPLKPPTVVITSPTDGETVSRANLVLGASAWGGAGVTNVEFYAEGLLLGSDSTAPYTWAWTTVSIGDHTVKARAYDGVGAWSESEPVSLHVVGNLAPTVSVTSPIHGMAVGTNVALAAEAADDVAVASVQFYDGETLLGADATAPYRFDWTATSLGPHTVSAVAWDGDGLSATSTVEITVVDQRARHVIVISVDGMGSAYVKPLLAPGVTNELTTFKRIQAEGSGTLNARTDADYAVTLPNHICMMTGRGVLGPDGHNWASNIDPAPTATLASNKGSYVASAFDVAHDNGLLTGIWSGKTKFSLFQQSYGPTTGAADMTGPDNGRDKIDTDRIFSYIEAAALTSDFTNRLTATPFHFTFVHYQDPDSAGHASGWSTNPTSAFAATLKAVDTEIGKVLDMVQNHPVLSGHTAVILTADHGGHENTHGDTTNPLDFTIPFYAWGAGVSAGGDLYAMNLVSRTEPSADIDPPYTGPQPIRNGDAGNLALDLLGLGPIPGSTIGSAQDLRVDIPAVPSLVIGLTPEGRLIRWLGSNAWFYTTQFTPSLAPLVPWSNLRGCINIPGSNATMSARDTNEAAKGYYRVGMSR